MKYLTLLILLLLSSNNVFAKDLLVVGAAWCPYCVKLKSHIEQNPEIVKQYDFEYIDIDNHPELKQKFNLDAYPTSFIFDDNKKMLSKFKGFQPNKFNQWLKKYE